MRRMCECILNGVYRIWLHEGVSAYARRKEEKRTWMSSWSDRQYSMVTVSDWFGAHMVELNLPPNMRISGNSTDTAYSSISNAKLSAERFEVICSP